jgi:hypothetical protein
MAAIMHIGSAAERSSAINGAFASIEPVSNEKEQWE